MNVFLDSLDSWIPGPTCHVLDCLDSWIPGVPSPNQAMMFPSVRSMLAANVANKLSFQELCSISDLCDHHVFVS